MLKWGSANLRFDGMFNAKVLSEIFGMYYAILGTTISIERIDTPAMMLIVEETFVTSMTVMLIF